MRESKKELLTNKEKGEQNSIKLRELYCKIKMLRLKDCSSHLLSMSENLLGVPSQSGLMFPTTIPPLPPPPPLLLQEFLPSGV